MISFRLFDVGAEPVLPGESGEGRLGGELECAPMGGLLARCGAGPEMEGEVGAPGEWGDDGGLMVRAGDGRSLLTCGDLDVDAGFDVSSEGALSMAT